MKNIITGIIDFFYPPFRKLMPVETFRYIACGGSNMLLGLFMFFMLLRYVFNNGFEKFGGMAFESYNVSLFFVSCTTFIIGFVLNKYVVFTSSSLRGRIQLFRYFVSFSFNFILNYFLLKLFVKMLHMDEFLSQVISTLIVVMISYATQKYFTFRKNTAAE